MPACSLPIAVSHGRIVAAEPSVPPLRVGRAGRDHLQRLLESAREAALIADAGGGIVVANGAACRLFEAASLDGMQVEDLMPPPLRHAHQIYRHVYQSMPQQRPMGKYTHLWARTLAGRDFCVQVELTPFATSRGVWTVAAIVEVGSGIA